MKKTIGLLILFIVVLGINGKSVYAQEAARPDFKVYFTPDTWVAPGDPVQVTAEISNTDPVNVLTGVELNLDFAGSGYFNTPIISTEAGFTCTMRNSGGLAIHMTANCSGGIIPAAKTISISFKDRAPSVVLYSYGINMPVYGKLDPWSISSSDTLLVVNSYKPDLVLSGTQSQSTVIVGQSVTYTLTVKSIGPLPTTASMLTGILPDGNTVSAIVPPMAAGQAIESKTFSFTYTPRGAQASTAKFSVDPDNTIAEQAEYNNEKLFTLTVNNALPDLTVNQSQPKSVAARSTFTQTLLVKNIGSSTAANIILKDTFSGTYQFLGISSFSSDHGFTCTKTTFRRWTIVSLTGYQCSGGVLKPGETATISTTPIAPYYVGTYSNSVKVDPGNLIKEVNEQNNSSITTFTVI